jgi:hypothetical protein
MKKFLVIIVVLALTAISSVAMAEVTVSGSVDIRSLMWNNNTDFSDKTGDRSVTTQQRYRINIDAKNDNVKGRITFENDWEQWGTETNSVTAGYPLSGLKTGVESRPGQSSATNKFGIREGWIDFTIPGATPAHVKVGHQFLQLGNGWFFRSMKYGSDAWLVGLPGKNTVAFVDVKVAEGITTQNDDVDAYVLLDNFKIDDTKTVGAYWAHVVDRRNNVFGGLFGAGAVGTDAALENIGLWFNGKLGPMNLQAEIDLQSGKAKGLGAVPDTKFKGNQIIVQGNMPVSAAAFNFTVARGTGDSVTSTSPDMKMYLPVLDSDPHYTVVYEYFAPTACSTTGSARTGLRSTGFCNTTALNIGGSFNATKWMNVSLDLWMLKATEKLNDQRGGTTDELGNEIDLVFKFKLYDQLTWNWQIARLMAGKAYQSATADADPVDAIQGILSYKF